MTPRPRPSRSAACAAFSLVELLISLSILALISAIAIPRYGSSLVRFRADAAVRRIVADLARTRQLARLTSTSQAIDFRAASNAYFIAGDQSLTTNLTGSLVDLSDEPYRARLKGADFAGGSLLTFNGFGVPDKSGTIVLKVGNEQRTITFDSLSSAATITTP